MDLPFTLQDMRQGWECPLCAGGEFQVQDELQILIRCAHGNVEQATRETDPESQENHWGQRHKLGDDREEM